MMDETFDAARHARGLAKLAELGGEGGDEMAQLGDLGRYIIDYGFGEIYSRSGLSLRDRELIAVAVLVAMDREPQVRFHLGAALRAGLTPAELEEMIIHTTLFAGFPTAINALRILKEVVGETTTGG